MTQSHPRSRHREAPIEKVHQATPKEGRMPHGLVSQLKIRGFRTRPQPKLRKLLSCHRCRLRWAVDQVFSINRRLRYPTSAAQSFQNTCPSKHPFDGADSARTFSTRFNASELASSSREKGVVARISHFTFASLFQKPVDNVLEKSSVVRLDKQAERTGFEDVRPSEQSKLSSTVVSCDRNWQRFERNSLEPPIKTQAAPPG